MGAEEVWQELAAERPEGPGIVRRRLLPGSERDIFLAVAHPSLRPMLVLRVGREALDGVQLLPSTRAVRTSVVEIDDHRAEIRLELEATGAVKVFAPFVEDVAGSAGASSDDAGAVEALLERFAHWRRLLSSEPAKGLGADAAQGLWGELWTMRHLLHSAWGDEMVPAWTGPDRDDNDFRRHEVAVEVKTTRADRPETVRISTERQLDHPPETTLFLVALAVDPHRHGGGENLPSMVDACRALVTDVVVSELDDRLLAWGYIDAHRSQYEETRYSLRGVDVFKVGDGFPRISEASLPNGIGAVSYSLSLDACRDWQIDTDIEMLPRLVGPGEKQ